MIIECPNCNKKFNLDEKLIPDKGRILKCSSCEHIWHHKVILNIDNNNKIISEDENSKFDIKPSQIQEWNEIKDPSKIFPGQVLKLYL